MKPWVCSSRMDLTALAIALICASAYAQLPTTAPDSPKSVQAIVLTPEGKPAIGAQAVLVPAGHWLSVINGRSFDNDPAYQRSTADTDGRVHFPGMQSPRVLVVIDASGYAQVDPPELLHLQQIHLQAWAHIHGRVRIGNQPVANAQITANPPLEALDSVEPYSLVHTDAEGRFAMDRVPAGKLVVAQLVKWYFRGKPIAGGTMRRHVLMLRAGQSTQVSIGGTGRPVVGAVELPAQLKGNHDWGFGTAQVKAKVDVPLPMPPALRNDSLVEREKWYAHFVTTDAGKKYLSDQEDRGLAVQIYPVEMAPDGTFRIQDVPAGAYTIDIDVRGEASGDHPAGKLIAQGQADFTVPEIPGGRSNEPLRIAPVPIKMRPHHVPSVGEMAPDFSIKTLAGKPLSLLQYRGKYVLLEFWATWCGSCTAATPRLQDVYTRYGRSGRVAMISLSEDKLPYAPSEYVHKHHLTWTQGFIGPDSLTDKQYGIEWIPSFWIIGPDGRIIAKPRYDADLTAAVSAALDSTHASKP